MIKAAKPHTTTIRLLPVRPGRRNRAIPSAQSIASGAKTSVPSPAGANPIKAAESRIGRSEAPGIRLPGCRGRHPVFGNAQNGSGSVGKNVDLPVLAFIFKEGSLIGRQRTARLLAEESSQWMLRLSFAWYPDQAGSHSTRLKNSPAIRRWRQFNPGHIEKRCSYSCRC
jgi:hypothetical protein